MKKLLLAILIVAMLFVMSGCSREVKKSPMGWALEATLKEYNESRFSGYGYFGYFIEEGIVVKDELDMLENNQSAKMYMIMVVDESGRGRLYNILIIYEQTAFDMYFGAKTIKKSQVIDVDIEEALYYD